MTSRYFTEFRIEVKRSAGEWDITYRIDGGVAVFQRWSMNDSETGLKDVDAVARKIAKDLPNVVEENLMN